MIALIVAVAALLLAAASLTLLTLERRKTAAFRAEWRPRWQETWNTATAARKIAGQADDDLDAVVGYLREKLGEDPLAEPPEDAPGVEPQGFTVPPGGSLEVNLETGEVRQPPPERPRPSPHPPAPYTPTALIPRVNPADIPTEAAPEVRPSGAHRAGGDQ